MAFVNTRDIFDKMATNGTWPSKYKHIDYNNYNFFTRRNAVSKLLDDVSAQRSFDLGCGSGDYLDMLGNRSKQVVGMDFSSKMIHQARQKSNESRQVFLFSGSGEMIPFKEDSFDVVIAIGYIEYFKDPSLTLDEIKRVMKPGGILIIQSYQIDFFNQLARRAGILKFKQILRKAFKQETVTFSVDRPYCKADLDQMMQRHGFKLQSYVFNNFIVIPRFSHRFVPNLYIRSSELISQHNPQKFCKFAVNYIGRYVLHSG